MVRRDRLSLTTGHGVSQSLHAHGSAHELLLAKMAPQLLTVLRPPGTGECISHHFENDHCIMADHAVTLLPRARRGTRTNAVTPPKRAVSVSRIR